MTTNQPDVEIQRRYYAETASRYEDMHVDDHDEHAFALHVMGGLASFLGAKSVLDIGSGTGRALSTVKRLHPEIRIQGIEPVRELREVAYAKGIPRDDLTDGDATRLPFPDGAFDLVCEFGVLHHIKAPELAVAEMLRVAKMAVFISDSNNFGQGGAVARTLKRALNAVGLWRAVDYVKTRGRGYTISEGDGLGYSYSVFSNYKQIERECSSVHVINTLAAGINPYASASHVALLGIKR